jgi:hypothetical protein
VSDGRQPTLTSEWAPTETAASRSLHFAGSPTDLTYSSSLGLGFNAVHQWLAAMVYSVGVIRSDFLIQHRRGGETECDLIVATKTKLYVIECKAHAKSAKFFRGDPNIVQGRLSQLGQDHKQASAAADAVKHELQLPDSSLSSPGAVEFCVCTPSQEFLRPVGKFGWLAPNIPRVCTPEELIVILHGVS